MVISLIPSLHGKVFESAKISYCYCWSEILKRKKKEKKRRKKVGVVSQYGLAIYILKSMLRQKEE